jgi:hypothetical protein
VCLFTVGTLRVRLHRLPDTEMPEGSTTKLAVKVNKKCVCQMSHL